MQVDSQSLELLTKKLKKTKQWKRFAQTTQQELELLYSQGYALYERGAYNQAISIFRILLLHRGFTPLYWKGLAACLQCTHQFEESMKAWAMNALLDNKDPTPHFHAAECAHSLEKTTEALKALSEAEKRVDPNHPLLQKIKIYKQLWGTS